MTKISNLSQMDRTYICRVGRAQTCDLTDPNRARYQLRHYSKNTQYVKELFIE